MCKIGKACFNFTLNVAFVLIFTQTLILIFIWRGSAQLLEKWTEFGLSVPLHERVVFKELTQSRKDNLKRYRASVVFED